MILDGSTDIDIEINTILWLCHSGHIWAILFLRGLAFLFFFFLFFGETCVSTYRFENNYKEYKIYGIVWFYKK